MKGQIGSYLRDLLGCDVFGTTRSVTQLPYIHCDITDYKNVMDILTLVRPDEVYNLAGETNSHESIKNPLNTFDSNGRAVMVLCESIKNVFDTTGKKIKFFQALSSELFKSKNGNEEIVITPGNSNFYPKTPYAIAKVSAYWTVRYYREKYGLPFYNGFIFNTESPFRKSSFLTRKISKALSQGELLQVENLYARKNWLHAKDVAKAIFLCMNGKPDEYVFSTGETYTVKELIDISYRTLGIKIAWNEFTGIDSNTGKILVSSAQINRSFDTGENVYGIDQKMKDLKWEVEYSLEDIMREMISSDSLELKNSKLVLSVIESYNYIILCIITLESYNYIILCIITLESYNYIIICIITLELKKF